VGSARRGTGRVGVGKSARERRLFQAQGEDYTLGDSLTVGSDGRLEISLAPDGPLKVDRDGVREKEGSLGETNLPTMGPVAKLETGASAAEVLDKVNELISELIRTRRSRT
jgi:hypothetical protein